MTDSGQESATLAYIRYVLQETKLSPSALAKEAGISPTTLTRPLNNPGHRFNLSATTLQKIAAVSGINPGTFFNTSDSASRILATMHSPGVYDKEVWGDVDSGNHLLGTIVIGTVGYGQWNEVGVAEVLDYPPLALRSTDYEPKDCFALYVADRHVGGTAYPRDYLLCVRYEAHAAVYTSRGWSLSQGELVIVERSSEDGRLVELTARKLSQGKDGYTLTCRANGDARYSGRLHIDSLPGDERTRVIGVVLSVVRDPME